MHDDSTVRVFGAVDFVVVILLLLVAAISITLFRANLLQTITLRYVEPVGYVVIRQNIVQRRLVDRLLWDRLATESPVFLGDLIRVAELSAATLYIEGNSIDLNENTLIRITRAPDGESLQLTVGEGTLSLAAPADTRGVLLDIGRRQVQVVYAAVINVSYDESGMTLTVNEGTAHFIDDDGLEREIYAGALIALDMYGVELAERAAVPLRPAPNARYLNAGSAPLPVSFSWNRINLDAGALVRLEIAADRNFNHVFSVYENLYSQAQALVHNGLWYWRLSYANSALAEGRFTVVDSTGPQLQSPAVNSVFQFTAELPVLNFHWDEVPRAFSYILEICDTPSFVTPHIQRHSEIVFFTDSSLGEGTWYWRVRPVFPHIYTGETSFSPVSFFRVDHVPVEPAMEELSLSEWLATENPSEILLPPEIIPLPEMAQAPVAMLPPVLPPAPPPPLPAPQNLQPASAHRFTMDDLLIQRSLAFSWQVVQGANAYIFSIYQQTEGARRHVYRSESSGPSYLLEDLRMLDKGTFIWQVEAVNRGAGGVLYRRGATAESTFIMDILLPGSIQAEGMEVTVIYDE